MGISRRALISSALALGTVGVAGAVGVSSGIFGRTSSDPEEVRQNNIGQPDGVQIMFADTTNVWGFGSSTMAFLGSHLADKFVGATFHAQGKGGERAQHIFARMGSAPALISMRSSVIPSSGAIPVRAWNVPPSRSLRPFSGSLAGIQGVLSSNDSTLFFTRTEPGAPHALISGTPFMPTTSSAVQNSVLLLNAGKNNLRDPGDPVSLVNTLTNEAYEWMSPHIKRCVVMTHFVNSDQDPGSRQFVNVQLVNQNILQTYADVAFDLNAYVLSSEIWAESNIRPTREDLRQQARGVKPDSLSRDAGHLSKAANAAVAARIGAHFIALGYYPAG